MLIRARFSSRMMKKKAIAAKNPEGPVLIKAASPSAPPAAPESRCLMLLYSARLARACAPVPRVRNAVPATANQSAASPHPDMSCSIGRPELRRAADRRSRCRGYRRPAWAVHRGGASAAGYRVDWLRGKIQVIDVMTRTGLRQWPKSKKSHRIVPVPPHIMEGMSALMTGRPRDALVFTAPEGGPVDDGNFRDRIWYPAVTAADIRRFPPPDHAPHRGELARGRRRAPVRRPGASRARELSNNRAVCPPRS
jgi:hypothetical protein